MRRRDGGLRRDAARRGRRVASQASAREAVSGPQRASGDQLLLPPAQPPPPLLGATAASLGGWRDGLLWMIEFPPPILEHFCPFLVQIAQMGLILPRMGLILPRTPLPTLFFTQQLHIPFGDMYTHKTPPTPPKNAPFPGLKSGKTNHRLDNLDPNWAKCSESEQYFSSGQNFSRSGQKHFIHLLWLQPGGRFRVSSLRRHTRPKDCKAADRLAASVVLHRLLLVGRAPETAATNRASGPVRYSQCRSCRSGTANIPLQGRLARGASQAQVECETPPDTRQYMKRSARHLAHTRHVALCAV